MTKVSPESETIFDRVLSLYQACDGNWAALASRSGVDEQSVAWFLEYAATVLDSPGNYKGYGDGKFIPRIDMATLQQLCAVADRRPDSTGCKIQLHSSLASLEFKTANYEKKYSDIKATHGRKNLTFSNRVVAMTAAIAPEEKIDLIPASQADSYRAHSSTCFFLRLALHELIGHGCGKLLQETSPGVFNFDRDNMPIGPFGNGQPVQTWYGEGETPESAFGGIATAYIECLAEGIGLYLMSVEGVLETLVPDQTLDSEEHSMRSLTIHLDRTKISTVGRPALGTLLHQLDVFRCIKAADRGIALLTDLTMVEDEDLVWRDMVLANEKPSARFVHANTVLNENGEVVLVEYPLTKEGLIQSWADRQMDQSAFMP